MKKHTIVSTLSVLICFALNVSAKTNSDVHPPESHQLPVYTVSEVTLPVPSKMVSPRLSRHMSGQEAELVFHIAADGRPYGLFSGGFSPHKSPFRSLESAMRAVLPYWRFEPALDKNGQPISVKVVLPVRIVERSDKTDSLARLAVTQPTILAMAD